MSAETGVNVIFNTFIGGLLAIIGSLSVAALYIYYQNKNQKKEKLNEVIRQNYFEQALNPVIASLSDYGIITTFALADASMFLGRCLQLGQENQEELKRSLQKISERPSLKDLTSHNFANISKWLSSLHKFGSEVHTSVFRTLQLYSMLSSEGTSYTNLVRSVRSSSVYEVVRSLGSLAQIIDMTLRYLEKRFINLQDYILMQSTENYDDFLKLFTGSEYTLFNSTMKEYMDGITQLMDAMKSPEGQVRKDTTLSFSSWLGRNMEINPFAKNKIV